VPVVTPQTFADAVFGAFNTFWASRCTVVWPNKAFDPDALGVTQTVSYVKPAIVDDFEGQSQINNSVTPILSTRTGVFGVEIFTRGEAATDLANQRKDEVLQFLETPPATIVGTVFRRRGIQTIGFNGVWYQVNVTAAFLYFTDRAP